MEVDEEGRQRLPQEGILELNLVIDKAQEKVENEDYLVQSVRKQQHAMEQSMANELRQQVPEMIRVSTGASRRSECPPPDAGETYTRPSSQSSRPVTQSGIRPGSRKDLSRQNTSSHVATRRPSQWSQGANDETNRDPHETNPRTGTTFDFLHVETTDEAKPVAEQSQAETLNVEQEDANHVAT